MALLGRDTRDAVRCSQSRPTGRRCPFGSRSQRLHPDRRRDDGALALGLLADKNALTAHRTLMGWATDLSSRVLEHHHRRHQHRVDDCAPRPDFTEARRRERPGMTKHPPFISTGWSPARPPALKPAPGPAGPLPQARASRTASSPAPPCCGGLVDPRSRRLEEIPCSSTAPGSA